MSEPKLDQSDYQACLDTLRLKSRWLAAEYEARTGERVTEPAATGDLIADCDTIQQRVASLESQLANLTPRQTGHNSSPAPQKTAGAASTVTKPVAKEMTLDEKILAAEGVKTPDELAAKRAEQRYGKNRKRVESSRATN